MFNINKKQFGKFWVENHEKEYFYGIIDFNTKDFILELIDTNLNISDEKVLINGVIENKPISFILINYPPNFQSYNIYDVCMGMHFDTKEDIKFEKIKFKINNISSVINFRSLELNSSDTFPLKREPFEEFPPILMKDFTVKIELNNGHENWKNRGNGQKITFEEDISIIIEYKKPQKIKTIHKNITCIKRLFTLLTGKSEITELKGIKEKTEINILSPYLLKENNNERKHAIRLNKNIEKVFKNWLTKYDEMDSVYNLFYSINESKGVNSITLFLTYSQILENYHRQKYNGKYLTSKEFKPIRKTIKENINSLDIDKLQNNEKLKQKILSLLNYGYEYSLKDRLIEVFNGLESYDFFNKILEKHAKNSTEPIKELAIIIRDNRDYYTHHGNKPKRVLPEKKLHEINESISKIIQLIMLKETGFESDEINKYIDYPQFYLGHYINLEY